ncbi:uncharacterized protein LOC121981180 [Zingiber officinale]|uniref:uncharacterized protein LOC121981180 n=1 Tax=Zingiber officinale TaxID=94328 RepID=UPI001C4D2288|nr:uncharacterized protein LOC121981180 [Zingiber officinale]
MEALTALPVSYLFPCCRRPVQAKSLSDAEPSLLQRDTLLLPARSASSRSPRRRFRRLRSSINGDKSDESQFFNEDGVVEDMDGYLNYLSLEYDSVWDTKPSWCQPWTILLAGIAVIASSWVILHSATISGGVTLLICGWWYIFLYSYPKAYSDMIAERRKKVSSGIEDTFGHRKSGR